MNIKLNGMFPLVNIRQAYTSHMQPLIGNRTGVCNSYLHGTLAFPPLPLCSPNMDHRKRRETELSNSLPSIRAKFTPDQRKLLMQRTAVRTKDALIHYYKTEHASIVWFLSRLLEFTA